MARLLRSIVWVGTKSHSDPSIQSLVTNAVVYLPLRTQDVDLDRIRALIFTSKHAPLALEHAFKGSDTLASLKALPTFVLAQKSAQVALDRGFSVNFIGQKGHGVGFVQEIMASLRALLQKNSSVLYVRAKNIASNMDTLLLQAHISLKQLVAYENRCLKLPPALKPKPHSILIFGAPSAYQAFLSNFTWDPSYIAIALGSSTFKAFDPSIRAFKSPKPTLESSITLAKTL